MANPSKVDPHKLTPNQAGFLEWLVTPSQLREPRTQEAWGKAHSVSQGVLQAWKKDLGFRQAWDRRLTELQIDPEKIGEVMAALQSRAAAGDTKAIQMYLQVADRFRPAPEPETTVRDLADLSDAELDALIADEVDRERSARAAAVDL